MAPTRRSTSPSRPGQVPRRGYRPVARHPRHWLSATPHVSAIDRKAGTFTTVADEARTGPRRTWHERGTVVLTITAPLVELSPATRRRLVLHQVLILRVQGPARGPVPGRRWQARYWTPRQIRQVRDDAARLHARFSVRALATDDAPATGATPRVLPP